MTSTSLKPCNPNFISAVGNLVSIAIVTPMPEPKRAIKPAKKSGEFSFHPAVYALVHHGIRSCLGGGGGAGHMSCPNLLVAYIKAHVVKMKEEVNPGMAHPPAGPPRTNMSPIRCENAIQVNAVIAAPNTEIKKVALFALTNGPDQNAIPVSIEL